MLPNSLSIPAFAKINWTLRVLGRRQSDNLHEIETVFQTISLCDYLSFEVDASAQLSLTSNLRDLPVNSDNLVIKAAMALQQASGTAASAGARIHLEKQIPQGGGLGGGSADAAVTLLALAKLWRLDLSVNDLSQIGATLGADVPFFFRGGTALGLGTGRDIYPLADAPAAQLLIVTPDVKVLTSQAYAALNASALTTIVRESKLTVLRVERELCEPGQLTLHNDFEASIFQLEPEIARARNALMAAGAQSALMTGSGSSVFGLFDKQETRNRAKSVLERESGWRAFACATLDRAGYQEALRWCFP